jgi:hypothetical protein
MTGDTPMSSSHFRRIALAQGLLPHLPPPTAGREQRVAAANRDGDDAPRREPERAGWSTEDRSGRAT